MKVTQAAALCIYILSILASIGFIMILFLVSSMSPHGDFWSALELVTAFSDYPIAWKILLSVAAVVVGIDVVLRIR